MVSVLLMVVFRKREQASCKMDIEIAPEQRAADVICYHAFWSEAKILEFVKNFLYNEITGLRW